ncbi:hypothetical protein LOK49_LG11G01439 [Camellia lanceoleosa]|uniref:Uncharacterized protein n=1 Tax=Camellia lanceoleosa TaxID=1840588 RepID=A0ACC0G046_9ERIC|nr:hypothetical protein LOK49_LG11G01439 [Camellia lanceoleosa]
MFMRMSEYGGTKKRNKRIMVVTLVLPETTTPELSVIFRTRIEELKGFGVVLLIQKPLYMTNVNKPEVVGDEEGFGQATYPYNLVKNWFSVVTNCGLTMSMMVQLWAFRVDS